MKTIQVTSEIKYRSPLWTTAGYDRKSIYYLPEREIEMPDGRIATVQPGGVSTKAEITSIARSLYTERPLRLEFPDGSVKEVKS